MLPQKPNVVCQMTQDCQSIQCCVEAVFKVGERKVCTSFGVNICDQLDFSIERKKWQRNIIAGDINYV